MTRRHVVTAVTLAVLAVVLCGMAVYGFKSAVAPFPGSDTKTKPSCNASKGKQVQKYLKRGDVQVSVYNAGSRNGLAGATLDKLEAAGFVAGDSGNAPGTAQVRRAVVWTTKPGDAAARLVALSLGRRTQVVVTQEPLGPGVDVLVGNKFNGLDRRAPTRIRLAAPITTCVQVGG
jgi:hypothetical protein